jgi:phosphatidate cytidylyltransferase
MLRTRLWMGAVLIALTVGVLWFDRDWAPHYAFLFAFVMLVAQVACHELLQLLPTGDRPHAWLCHLGIAALVAVNWSGTNVWHYAAGVMAAILMTAFIVEMALFREPGRAVIRIALTLLVAVYLGLLPMFLAQLRWQPGATAVSGLDRGALAFGLGVFVPKCCDIGAYFTGRMIGRHPMTPTLSPKKTWEGLAGGLATAMVVALGLNRLGPLFTDIVAAGFGLTVGLAGVLGDLAESLIKRDVRQKDASQVVPGFGGVLDVVDAVLFAAPVTYAWCRLSVVDI